MRKIPRPLILILLAVMGLYALNSVINPPITYPESLNDVEKAALKAARIQENELREMEEALRKADGGKIVYGDRFLRWTLLAYTLWHIDRNDQPFLERMKTLLPLYYERAWYPNVKNKPPMPFSSLVQYIRADGSWENYWADYKPVHVAAFMLEYYVLSSFDKEWGRRNYFMLKNVSDSLTRMWLPGRHAPSAYIDTDGRRMEIKNITISVDTAMEYAALLAASRVAEKLGNDPDSASIYRSYASDIYDHFFEQTWEWFPSRMFGKNSEEEYGFALQVGMTVPFLDAEDRLDTAANYLLENLRFRKDSWLLKWRTNDSKASSRSVFAAIGLAPRYSVEAWSVLNAYARESLRSDSWFLSGTDEYEASDPVWVSGKFLMTYMMFKQRVIFGRTVFSPSIIMGNYSFRSHYPEFGSVLGALNSSIATLEGTFFAKVSGKEPERSYYTIRGIPNKSALISLATNFEPTVSLEGHDWRYYRSGERYFIETRLVFPEQEVSVRVERRSS